MVGERAGQTLAVGDLSNADPITPAALAATTDGLLVRPVVPRVKRRLSDRERWLVERVTVAFALAHLLVPDALLTVARLSYRLTLAVDFDPTDAATRRVRLVGIGMLIAVALVRRTSRDQETKSYSDGDATDE